ncbi:hypothetical protein IWW47_005663, partial [Coemansia sp. RSA 2052]
SDFGSEKQLASTQETEELEICAQLDRVNAWRLDSQCAVRRPRQARAMELGNIMHRAGRLVEARRLANQDFTPARLRRIASLERVADGLDAMADARSAQRMALSSQRVRELFLVGIAARLGRVDGCTEITRSPDNIDCCRFQCAEHPRDHMRRFVISSIERINRLSDDLDMPAQRFLPRKQDVSLHAAAAVGASIAVGALLAAQHLRPTPSVRGRNVVIVGASSGIGRSLALEFAQRGANLVLCARRPEQLANVADACRQFSVDVHTVVGDITQRETQLALYRQAKGAYGVDYLVLNAGAISVRPITDLWPTTTTTETELQDEADRAEALFQQILSINAVAPATVAGLFLPLLTQSKGVVVVVSSVAGLVAAPTRSL